MKLSLKHLFSGVIIGAVLLAASFISLPDGKLHLVFCDVGQGDAIYMRTPDGSDILFDGGPNDKVLTCLSKHMPFYDRTIELVLLSHPQADHLSGLISVLQRYSVNYFVSNGIGSGTEGYKKLVSLIKEKKITIKNEIAGEKMTLDNLNLAVVWPTAELVASLVPGIQNKVLGATTSDSNVNESCLVVKLTYGSFDALLTGDADTGVEKQKNYLDFLRSTGGSVEVLKVPHHGSKTGMTDEFLNLVKPKLAVISVGLNNSYGHPTKEILGMLSGLGIKTLRTDLDGEVEVVSDGKSWKVN